MGIAALVGGWVRALGMWYEAAGEEARRRRSRVSMQKTRGLGSEEEEEEEEEVRSMQCVCSIFVHVRREAHTGYTWT